MSFLVLDSGQANCSEPVAPQVEGQPTIDEATEPAQTPSQPPTPRGAQPARPAPPAPQPAPRASPPGPQPVPRMAPTGPQPTLRPEPPAPQPAVPASAPPIPESALAEVGPIAGQPLVGDTGLPSTPSTDLTGLAGLARGGIPQMIGDLGPGLSIPRPYPPTPPPTPPSPRRASALVPSVRGLKVSENQSPRPQDRVFFTFDYFSNVNGRST